MVQNNQELEVTLARMRHFQKQIEKLREVETNPQNYRFSVGGFLAEIDRMNLEVREYLSIHPSQTLQKFAFFFCPSNSIISPYSYIDVAPLGLGSLCRMRCYTDVAPLGLRCV